MTNTAEMATPIEVQQEETIHYLNQVINSYSDSTDFEKIESFLNQIIDTLLEKKFNKNSIAFCLERIEGEIDEIDTLRQPSDYLAALNKTYTLISKTPANQA